MKYHTTKNGQIIRLCDLSMKHLSNIIKHIEKKSKEGVIVESGGIGMNDNEPWYDKDIYYGKKAKKLLHYNDYKSELKRRLKIPKDINLK